MNNKAMYNISYGLYVLTSQLDGKDNGCIINTLNQVTTTPNQVTIAVNKQNYTHDMVMASGKFNASLLSEDASFATFQRFGFQSGRTVDKFAGFDAMERSESGLYYVTGGSNGFIGGVVKDSVDLGTHTLFIADVTEAEVLSDKPSLTYAYYQANIKPKPEAPKAKGWRCRICGWVYEGDPLPEDIVCPLCKHGAIDFERIG